MSNQLDVRDDTALHLTLDGPPRGPRTRADDAYTLHDATRVREHLEDLAAQGWKSPAIAHAAEEPASAVEELLSGEATTCTEAVGRRILDLTPERLLAARPPWVPARLVSWKVGALMAQGWSPGELARRLGYPARALCRLTRTPAYRLTRDSVAYDLYCDINDLFEQLEHLEGSSPLARRSAAALGYEPASCYTPTGTRWADEPDINADEQETRARAELMAWRRLEVLRLTMRRTVDPNEIARRLGMSAADVVKYREQAKLFLTNVKANRGAAQTSLTLPSLINPLFARNVPRIMAAVEEWEANPQAVPADLVLKYGLAPAPILGWPTRASRVA